MKNVLRLVWSGLLFATLVLAGCSGSHGTSTKPESIRQKPVVRDRLSEMNRDLALQHFIEGITLDAKERYAEAILEYQEVLQYDPNAATYYAISRDYALLGKSVRASEAARDAVKLDSMKIAYRENLASIYISMFQQEMAIQEYEAVVRIDSTYAAGWYNLARLYQQKRPLKALGVYEKLLDNDPDNWDILLQAADLSNTLGRYTDAANYYKRMLDIDPSNRPLQRQLAETYSKAGKMDEAVKLLEAIHEVDRNDLDVSAILGEIYLQQQQYQKAASIFEPLLKRDKPNPEIKLRVGVAYVGQIQRDSTFAAKAKKIFVGLESELPNDFRVYWYLGIIASNEKQDSVAATYFERVTSLDEKNAEAWSFLGSNYFERGEYQKLLKSMEQAQKLFPSDARFYLLSGLAYSRLGRPDPAIQMLEQSYRINPKDMNTLGQLALTYDGLRRWKECDSLYEEALRVDSTSAAAAIILNNYGYSLAERGLQLDRALRMATKAVELEPDNASYLDTLGWIYFKFEKYDEAERYIAKAVSTGSASAVVNEHLGDVYFRLGSKDKAMKLWQHALEMDKTNQALKYKIERGSL